MEDRVKIPLYLRLSENGFIWIPDQVGNDPTIQEISDTLK